MHSNKSKKLKLMYKEAIQLLRKYQLPATLCVTTYYSQHQNPVFRLVIQYIFWATQKKTLDLDRLLV